MDEVLTADGLKGYLEAAKEAGALEVTISHGTKDSHIGIKASFESTKYVFEDGRIFTAKTVEADAADGTTEGDTQP
jgi:hypothetical protein